MSGARVLVSDFGGVLTSPLPEAFARIQGDSGIPPEALGEAMARLAERDGANPLHELECGRMTEPDFMGRLAAELEAELGRPVSMHTFSERYFAALEPNAEMLDLVRAVRERGVRTALLTNNVREWEPRWRAMLPVDELFELVVDSAFVGLRKPDAAIYHLTCERLGVRAEQCVFVDDIEVNCTAARELGMTAVHFRTTAQARREIAAALDGPASA
jgi:epoxide hydrolase-like predicted phosphatase